MTEGRSPRTLHRRGRVGASVELLLARLYERHGPRYMRAPLWVACFLMIPLLVAAVTPVVNRYLPIPASKLAAVIALVAGALYATAGVGWLRMGVGLTALVSDWWERGRPDFEAAHVWNRVHDVPAFQARLLATWGMFFTLVAGAGIGALLGASFSTIVAAESFTVVADLWTAMLFFFVVDVLLRPVQLDAASRLPSRFTPTGGVSFGRRILGSMVVVSVLAALMGVTVTGGGTSRLEDLVVGPVLLAVTVGLVTSLAMTGAATRSMMRPVDDLIASTARIAAGDLSARVAVTSKDEFGRLAANFNEMSAELQRSREQLIVAREEERRRLRRDLHDGLGPALAGVAVRLEAVRGLLRRDDSAGAEAMLVQLRADTVEAIADIRRLVQGLRPPQLDELGLVGAIEERASRLAPEGMDGGPRVMVEAPPHLPALPAALEVAAYRIVEEALTNVIRHSGARACTIRISVADVFAVEVGDDGQGLSNGRPPGIGLSSMRERAAEVGGTCSVDTGPDGGTVVLARLPLPSGPG